MREHADSHDPHGPVASAYGWYGLRAAMREHADRKRSSRSGRLRLRLVWDPVARAYGVYVLDGSLAGQRITLPSRPAVMMRFPLDEASTAVSP